MTGTGAMEFFVDVTFGLVDIPDGGGQLGNEFALSNGLAIHISAHRTSAN